ncbi:MAG TPA: ATP synthase F1 subunit gamma [Bacteroidales bacterium]|jgi:F-type H+-transporting ATPase subunit gamma|nr:ATP synthase F1 subunit gamma [Bacteroidales bacterium]HPY21471.1 ATP synthase F1 subunit gamma [Bacteroidales bacterium]HQA92443.1 ATP synthase F1 subunit gamma [Bacteroidales bacterium]HQN23398.1 ATP synthase F1 subunit gamma [Bacteroidales bacterium]HQP78639.1 ATP synthase F1 subunit gamma [Bacteroidales bacterium]
MAQLKDIKTRLQSVRSTQKITSAMMLVASAKLRKTQRMLDSLEPYLEGLSRIYNILLAQRQNFNSPLMEERPVERVALVVFSSNTGLAGRFNHLVSAELLRAVESYKSLGESNILLYSFGDRGVRDILKRGGVHYQGKFQSIADKPSLVNIKPICDELMEKFTRKEIDKVELIHHHFVTKGTQVMTRETLLPFKVEELIPEKGEFLEDYIIEPDSELILRELTPLLINLQFLIAHIDSLVSEHIARMTAMQIATDNADELVDELTLEYNKLRQQAITAELLDIMGGSFGR